MGDNRLNHDGKCKSYKGNGNIGYSLNYPNSLLLQVQMVSSMRIGRNVNYRILDIDWCTSDKVVLASDDGCIRVLEMGMKSASYRMDEQDLTGEQGNRDYTLCCDARCYRIHGLTWCSCLYVGNAHRSSVVPLPAAAPSCPDSQGFPSAAALVRNLHHGHHSGVSLTLEHVSVNVSSMKIAARCNL